MTTTTVYAPPPTTFDGKPAGLVASTMMIAKRTVLKFLRTPQLIVVSTIQGAMFLLIFRYVFGGAIGVEGISYVNFLVPGYVATGVLFSGAAASAGVAEDLELGFVDRLRSLPISRAAVLTGRALADTALVAWGTLITVIVGFLVGFTINNGVGNALLAFALCIVFGFAFEWMFVLIGLMAGSAQAANGFSLLVFPFVFVSSAFVPIASMPDWMQVIARNQPVTPMVNSVRCLTQGRPAEILTGNTTDYWIQQSLIWCVALVLVFGFLAVARFRKG
jgi:ABC-2 type transport system permease protein